MKITVKYGTGNTLTKEVPAGTTLGSILRDQSIQGALGYGNNVEGHIGSVPQPNDCTLQDGMTVSVYDKACQKAV